MKKFCLLVVLLFSNAMYALPVGNPTEASLFYPCQTICNGRCDFLSFGTGFYGDYVFNRHMETVHDKDIDRTTIVTNAAYLAVNFFELVDLFSSLGVSRISLSTSLGAFNPVDRHPLFEVESESSFSYSIGARATLVEYRCFALGIVGQYFATRPNIKRMYIASGAVVYPDDILKTRYGEGQFAAGIAYQYNKFFIPYAALKYAHAFWKFGDGENFAIEDNRGTFLYNMNNGKNFGYVIGLTLNPPVCRQLAVTVEGRFADETALYVNAQARY